MKSFAFALILWTASVTVAAAAAPSGLVLPTYQSSWQNPHGNAFRVRLQGNIAYVTNDETSHLLEIVDVSNPKAPVLLSHGPPIKRGGYITGLAVNATHAFVGHNGYVTAVDVRDPRRPKWVSEWSSGAAPSRMFLQLDGATLFVGVGSKGVFALDVSDPAKLRQVGFFATPSLGKNALPISNLERVSGRRLMVVFPGDRTYLTDVTDPARMRVLQPLPVVGTATLAGRRLYTSEGPQRDSVVVRDVSDPEHPSVLGSVSIEPQAVDFAEVTREGQRYLIAATAATPAPKPINGQSMYPGESLVVLNVQDPRQMRVVSSAGPRTTRSLTDPYYGYAALVVRGNYSYAATYFYGLDITDLSDLAHPKRVAGVGLSGEGRWISTDGRHLFMSNTVAGVMVLDISQPLHPRHLGTAYTGAQYFEHSHAFANGYVYAIGDSDWNTAVIDVRDPAHPKVVKSVNTGVRSRGIRADISGEPYLITFGWTSEPRTAFSIVDVSVPASPVVQATVRLPTEEGTSFDALLDGSRAWVATPKGGVHLYDVTDRMKPRLVNTIARPLGVGNLAIDRIAGRRYLFAAARDSFVPKGPDSAEHGGLFVYDITTPESPRLVKHLYAREWTRGGAEVLAMTIHDNLLYLADYWTGVHVYDVSDPAEIRRVPFKFKMSYYPTGLVVTDKALYVSRIDGLAAHTLPRVPPGWEKLLGSVTDLPEK